jgi:hypothetical protein
MTCTKYLIWVLELFDLIRHNIGLGPIKSNSNIIHDMHQDAMLSDELELAPPPPPGAHQRLCLLAAKGGRNPTSTFILPIVIFGGGGRGGGRRHCLLERGNSGGGGPRRGLQQSHDGVWWTLNLIVALRFVGAVLQ